MRQLPWRLGLGRAPRAISNWLPVPMCILAKLGRYGYRIEKVYSLLIVACHDAQIRRRSRCGGACLRGHLRRASGGYEGRGRLQLRRHDPDRLSCRACSAAIAMDSGGVNRGANRNRWEAFYRQPNSCFPQPNSGLGATLDATQGRYCSDQQQD